MNTVAVDSALNSIQKYLKNDVATPFIVVVDDDTEFSCLVNRFTSFKQMRVSGFCAEEDTFPDNDALFAALSKSTENILLLGFGENVRLSGNVSILGRLKDTTVSSKVVALCRGIRDAAKTLCLDDNKFGTSRHICLLKAGASSDVINFPSILNIPAERGLKALLYRLEGGVSNTVIVKTALHLKNIREVHSAYNALQQLDPTFTVHADCLSDSLWAEYLADRDLKGYVLFHWRHFLKLKLEPPKDVYLKYVIDKSSDFNSYAKIILSTLLDFDLQNKDFDAMYEARKVLLRNFESIDIAEYISETKVKAKNRVYYLTDNTAAERQAIIESLDGLTSIPVDLKKIYPSLSFYLSDYIFSGDNGNFLTEYFSEYKRQKLTNRLSPEFHDKVISLAADGCRPYNSLKTRGEVLDTINKDGSALFWIDSLGVEYLGYIQKRAQSLGLRITVHTVRANLPSLTSLNNDFYESWTGYKIQTKELDKVKHHGEQDFNYEATKLPIHLGKELQIIDDFLQWAATKLIGKNFKKIILVSDHGASRLAVINEQECKWEMSSMGQHSGRCCPCSDTDVKFGYATQENGFWVLANYDRFKGGRKASVEVHGGATLEEVVVPLVEVELFDNRISITNTTPIATTSFKKNAEIVLFSTSLLKNLSAKTCENRYMAEDLGNQTHRIVFPDIKKSGKYRVDLFEGDNLIGQIEFEVQRESGGTNDNDWF